MYALAMGKADAFAARTSFRVPDKKSFDSPTVVNEKLPSKDLESVHTETTDHLNDSDDSSTLSVAPEDCLTVDNMVFMRNPVPSAIGA